MSRFHWINPKIWDNSSLIFSAWLWWRSSWSSESNIWSPYCLYWSPGVCVMKRASNKHPRWHLRQWQEQVKPGEDGGNRLPESPGWLNSDWLLFTLIHKVSPITACLYNMELEIFCFCSLLVSLVTKKVGELQAQSWSNHRPCLARDADTWQEEAGY